MAQGLRTVFINRGKSGIIYCLSKKDTEVVAQGLMEASKGAIKVRP